VEAEHAISISDPKAESASAHGTVHVRLERISAHGTQRREPRTRGWQSAPRHVEPGEGHHMTDETDDPEAPSEPPDAEPDYEQGVPDESSGTSTSDLPEGATEGELPPAP
jgi:hypothetical protein